MNASRPLRILFAGTPDFAVVPLKGLLENGFTPVGVLTQPDRPAGRGREMQASPVKQTALRAGIDVFQPPKLRTTEARDLVAALAPDLMIVVAYGLILPTEILDIPVFGCWNIHASLLPRWRGAAPIQRAIEAGDRETGVSIMQMEPGLDTGPVIHRLTLALDGSETGGSLHDALAALGARALLDCLRQLLAGECPVAVPQPEHGVSYADKLRKEEAEIDWSLPGEELERRIRAFNPWPVTWCWVRAERTRVWKALLLRENSGQTPGTVLSASRDGIDIATGGATLRLLELQPPGKRRMDAADYLNARSLPTRLVHSR